MTADELLVLAEDRMRHELVAGELTTMNPPGSEHGRVALTVGALLFVHVRETGCGVAFAAETGFVLARDPDTVRAPDAAFVSKQRYEVLGPTAQYWPEAPDFAAEVVSPGDSFTDVQTRALGWLEAGCKAVLVIDPQRRAATVYRARDDIRLYLDPDGEQIDLSDAVPGWVVSVGELLG